jgi:hypothetical protein
MDADAELDPALGWNADIAFDHAVLYFDRAAHRVHHAVESRGHGAPINRAGRRFHLYDSAGAFKY